MLDVYTVVYLPTGLIFTEQQRKKKKSLNI